jgi:16S rRNA (cytosine1402-N4)-methyltransferase
MAHESVLLHESIDGLALRPGDIFLDATVNGGGHSIEVCRRFKGKVTIIGIDLDKDALERASALFAAEGCSATLHEENFRNLDGVLEKEGIKEVNAILLDLGFSSDQIEASGRGFSFRRDEPLLMTFSKEPRGFTARDIVNDWDGEHIETIIRHYGEERRAGKITRAILDARKERSIETSGELCEIIERVCKRQGKLHPATKTFQALRMAVNDELDALKDGLTKGFDALAPDGRLAVISFHSLEDRLVKRFFKDLASREKATIIIKKPITPSVEEQKHNPRSRSAKLRIIRKNDHTP